MFEPCLRTHDSNSSAKLGRARVSIDLLKDFKWEKCILYYLVTHVRSAYAIIVRATPVMDRANPT